MAALLLVLFFNHGRFYIFDFYARNQQCDVDPHDSILLLSFESTDTLQASLHRVNRGHMFNVSVIHLSRRISDCNTLEDHYLLTTLHIERSLDAPDSGYLKHASLGVGPDVIYD